MLFPYDVRSHLEVYYTVLALLAANKLPYNTLDRLRSSVYIHGIADAR